MRHIIVIDCGYVTGFDEEHMIVTTSDNPADGKKMTINEVDEFMNDYADAGYGLTSDNYTLIDIE